MKNVVLIIIAAFGLQSISEVHANHTSYQKVNRQLLTVTDGLASNETNCIVQDSKGFIWLGTTNGLCKYDGFTMTKYKSNYLKPTFLSNNNILSLAEDHNLNLWIGTQSGLNILELETNKIKSIPEGFPKDVVVNSIVVDKKNNVYIATEHGLFLYENAAKSFTKITSDSKGFQLLPVYIKTLFIDSKNYLWIGHWGAAYSVYNLNTNSFVEYPYLKDKKDLIVNSFFEDDENNIWLSTWDQYGVWKISSPHQPSNSHLKSYQLQQSEKSIITPVVYAINQDISSKDILLASSNGIQVIPHATSFNEANTHVNYEASQKLMGGEIFTLYIDRTGLIWYSVYGTGVGIYTTTRAEFNQESLLTILNGDNLSTSVTAIYEDEDDNLWLGIKSFVLGVYNKEAKSFLLYNEHPELKKIDNEANTVISFFKPSKMNELWLGTRFDGIYSVKKDANKGWLVNKKTIKKLGHKNLSISCFIESSDNEIWIGTNRGLALGTYNESTKEYDLEKSVVVGNHVKGHFINSLLLDSKNRLWIATKKSGVFCYIQQEDKNSIMSFNTSNNGVNNDEITCVFEDYKNRIWVGTKGGGLNKFNPELSKFELISSVSDFPDDAIYSIEEDNWGNMWIGTGNSLVCYNEDSNIHDKIKIYAHNDGVKVSTFNVNSSFKNNKNELFFGGSNGFISFIPQKRELNRFTHQPVITNILIDNQSIENMAAEDKHKITTKNIPYSKELKLKHTQKNISIEFASLNFESNLSIKYAYQLENFDKSWIYVDSKKYFATYNNLPSGKYTFKLKSTNEDGVWCEKPTMLKIIIKPAPWNTIFAYILYIILVSVILYLIFRFINNQLNLRRMLAIEQIEREKSEEVNQTKLRFFTNISHEFFTPITIMKCAVDSMIDKYPSESRVFFTMKANMDRLIRLLEQIIEFRRVETGNLKLKLKKIEIVSFIRDLCYVHFKPLSTQKNISLNFYSEVPEIEGFIDCDKIDKIIYNLLSNAFKYNKDGGTVNVSLKVLDVHNLRKLFITIEDNGIGMNKNVLQNVFNRYFVSDNHASSERSIGIGLSLVYELVKFHQGEISAESELNVGTKFYITLPIDKEEYIETDATYVSQYDEDAIPDSSEKTNNTQDDRLKLLVIEDNIELLLLLEETLKKEFFVYKASNGVEAWKLINKYDVDVVVTDVFMPEMDGNEFTKKLKSVVELSHIPVIMLSAQQDVEHKVEGFEAGADSYLTKPFEMPALIANIKSLVKNRQLQAESFNNDLSSFDVTKYTHNDTDKMFLENVFTFIEENVFDINFSTNDLYDEMNMSQSTFYRKLKSLIDISPIELIRKIKIDIASKMLLDKGLTVSDISYSLGFNDPKYFSSVFKKIKGVTPSEYIKSMENKEN